MAKQPHLLVADPDAEIADILAIILRDEGYRITVEEGRAAALRFLEGHTCDLVLAELVNRPASASAWEPELVERASPIPVGLITAWPVDAEEARRHGFAFTVHKPPNLAALFHEIAAALGSAAPPLVRDLVEHYFAALSARDWDGLARLCTDNVVYELPAPGEFASRIEGRRAFREFTEQTFAQFPAARFHDVVVFGTPQGATARYRGTWRAPDGRDVESAGSVTFVIEGAFIRHIGVRLDQERQAQQISQARSAG